MRCKQLLLVLAAFIFSLSYAQEKPGSIAGFVKDSHSKIPLIEAVVTVSSPVMEGQRFAVTDSLGMYKILNLPSGVYSVSFEMEGFKKYTQDNVKLTPGMSLGVSFEMARARHEQTEPTRTRFRKREVVAND
jgi:hypothetical protein